MNYYPEFMNFDYNNLNIYNQNKTMKNQNELYDPYNGLIRGNLFKKLYDPYISEEPYKIKPMNDQAKMLTKLDSLGFAMVDLNLYLDVYPNDKEKINLYNQYRREKENLLKEYENKYGPITLTSDSLNTFPWAWNNMPWPWEN